MVSRKMSRKEYNNFLFSRSEQARFVKERAKPDGLTNSTPAQLVKSKQVKEKVAKSSSKHQIEFDFDTKAGRYKGSAQIAGAVGVSSLFGLAAVAAARRNDRYNKSQGK